MMDEELQAIHERIEQLPLLTFDDLDGEVERERVRQAFRDRRVLLDEVAQLCSARDDLLGLAMAVANGWPNESAPAHVREEYIEALKSVAADLLDQHPERVVVLRARNVQAASGLSG